VQYTILKGGGNSFKDKVTDLMELRPWEKKIQENFAALRALKGPPVCYTRFKGTEKEDFFCDRRLEKEKEQDRKTFVYSPTLTEAEKQRLAGEPLQNKTIVFNQIQDDRIRYLNKLDDTVNYTYVPSTLGYPPRFGSPQPDLIYGGYSEFYNESHEFNRQSHEINKELE
jgi:hypothetical protein